MSDVNANIGVHIDTSSALTELKNLQRQLANFHASIAKTSSAAAAAQRGLQTNLLNSINATGKFTATMGNVRSSTESFTHALESNKLSMREYFRYAGGASKSFGKLFRQEFDTIGKVAEDRVKKMQTQYIKMGRDANGAIKAMAITPTTLNMQDYGTKTAIAAQKQALFNQLMKQGSTNLLNFGKNTQWAGRQLMVGFTIPLAMLGTTAAKTFMDLEAQAIKFKRVYGDMFTTSDETNKALEDVQKLAEGFTKYGVAVTKTMEMAASAAAMGKTGADLTAQVAEATRLAVLGGVEQEQALETTISLTNAFGIAAEDLASKIDFLNSVENQTIVSIEDLTIAIPKAGPVVKQLGGDVQDLAFFLTAMKEGGINASEGANALKSGLAPLINPSEKASKFLASLGVNIKGIVEGNQGDIRGTVIAFSQALDTLDPLNRARAIEQLFGKFQFSRLSTLFQNVTKDGTQAAKVLELAGASVEQLAILSERELKTVENAIGTQFKSAVEELRLAIAPIGKTFLQAVTPIVEVIGNLLEKFNGLSDGTKKFIVVATTIVGGIGPILLMTFGLLANGIANIVKLFLALRGGFLRLGGNSKILAEQTSYLNTEQLESATVAASLNQAHTRLTQSFTAEASAVKALRAAYVDATIAASNFARANPGMMMPVRGKAPKKFAQGTTGLPGPRGAGDIIPILGAPGEAIIPANVAQDDRFKPIISAMVNGTLQGFESGTENLKKKSTRMSSPTQKSHVGTGKEVPISEILQSPNLTDLNKKKLEAFQQILKANGLPATTTVHHSLMYEFNKDFNRAMAGSGIPTADFLAEWDKLGTTKWSASGISQFDARTVDNLMSDIIKEEKPAKITDDYVEKIFAKTIPEKYPEVANSTTYRRMAALHQNLEDFRLGKGLKGTVAETTAVLEKAKAAGAIKDFSVLPTKDNDLDTKGRLITGTINVTDNNGNSIALGRGSSGDRITTSRQVVNAQIEAIKQEKNKKGGKSLFDREAEIKKIALETNKSPLKNEIPEKYVRQVEKTTGFSFTAAPGIGGVYEKSDGSRVFVKPAMDYKSAIAEQRAIQIARSQGLDTPSQTIKTMIDPTDVQGKRKLIILESPFDDRFNPAKMQNTFSKDEYFKQLVASSLRGDSDLKRGNLSGNILADVGAAGVFDTASGTRDYSKNMRSMEEQARINLGGEKGGQKFFRETTANIPQSMTADEYHNRVIQEIDRTLPKLQQTIAGFDLDPNERKVYQAMIDRLKAGKNVDWRQFHKLHSSVLVAKDESFQDKKTGKVTKIKGEPKPSGVKPSSGKLVDNTLTTIPKGKRVVKTPTKRVGKFIVPGLANAPEATGISVDSASQSVRLKRAQVIAATEGISLNAGKKKAAAEEKYANSLDKSSKVINESTKNFTNFSNKANLGIGAVTGLTVAASFAEGKIGEMAQKIMPFVFGIQGITMLLPLLANPWVAFIAAVAVVGGAMWKMAKDVEDARKEGVNLAKAMNMTSEKLQDLSVLTGTVSASEEANRKRQGVLTGEDAVQRKFGQNILGSEFGKSLIADIEKQAKSGQGIKEIGRNISNSLAYAVVQGVITTNQAKSISSALGEELKSYEIPAIISGRLTTLLGPNGENLATDPLKITLAIQEESMTRQADFFKSALEQSISTTTFTNLGQVIGGSIVAAIGGTIAVGTGFTGVGAVTGGAIAAAGGTIVGQGLSDQNKRKEVNAKLGAAALQLGLEQVTMNNGLVDSLNKQYDIKIKMAKTDAEVQKIELERRAALETFNAKNAEALNLLIAQKDAFGPEIFTKGINAAVDSLYKEGPMKVFADEAKKALEGVADADFKAMLQVQFASGSLDPIVITKLANNQELQSQFKLMVETSGSEEANVLMQLLVKSGASDTNLPIFMDLINKDPKNFKKNMEAISILANMQQKYGITININDDGVTQIKEVAAITEKLAGIPEEELSKKLFFELGIVGDLTAEEFDSLWTSLVGTSKTINKSVIIDFVAAGDENVISAYMADKGIKIPSNFSPEVIKGLRENLKTDAQAWLVGRQGKKVTGGGVTGSGSGETKAREATPFDSILQDLKRTRDASIDALGGAKELMRILSGKKDLKLFSGIDQQLSKIGANSDFIDFVGGLENAVKEKIIKINKQGVVSFGEFGEAAKKAYDEKQLGSFSAKSAQAITELKKQQTGFVALKSAGASSSDALEMVSDANFAIALSAAKTSGEIQVLINQFKALKQETQTTLASIDPQQYFNDQMAVAERQFNNQEAMAKRTYEPQIEALQLTIDATNRLIDAEQNRIKLDYDKPIESKQKEISVLQNEISMGVQKQLDENSKISASLSEDQAVIGNIVDQINNKYDLQEKALTKISNINQDIIEQQKDQIGLADALTKGDISAAAQAAEDMKQRSAAAVASKAQEMLDQRRQADIAAVVGPSGLTAEQISKRQYDIDRRNYSLQVQREAVETKIQRIEEDIYKLQVDRDKALTSIAVKEEAIYKINVNQIQPLRDKLRAELDTIDAQRTKWTDAQLAIEGANIRTKEFQDKLIAAEGLIKSVGSLWKDITDKNLKLTIQTIEEVIKQQASSQTASEKTAAEKITTVTETYDPRSGNTPDYKAPSNFTYGQNTAPAFKEQSTQEALDTAAEARTAASFSAAAAAGKSPLMASKLRIMEMLGLASGGMVPKYFAAGGLSRGTDTIPAMLTPGEFVINKNAANSIGTNNLNKLNNGQSMGNSVYNYSVGINVSNSNANSEDIARAVIGQIKYIDSQRIRGQR